jgi:hypothetical protein
LVSRPFWWPIDSHRLAVEEAEAGDDRLVVGKAAVAVHLGELGEQALDVVEHDRAVGMAGDLHDLPRLERRVDLAAQLRGPRFELRDRRAPLGRLRHHAQRLDLLSAARRRSLRNPECLRA